MKPSTYLVILATLASSGVTDARPRPAQGGGDHKHFEANKVFGLGLELGEPTSINGKYFYASDKAIDFGVGDTYDYNGYRGLTLYADHLWHPFVLASADAFELPFYVGVGARYWRWQDYNDAAGFRCGPGYCNGDAVGARAPVGLAFDFNNVPLDVYIQLVPTVDLFVTTPNGYGRSLYLEIDGNIGIRYWFK